MRRLRFLTGRHRTPSINRLLGLAWLAGGDPRALAGLFNAVVYGHVLTAPQLDALLASVHPVQL